MTSSELTLWPRDKLFAQQGKTGKVGLEDAKCNDGNELVIYIGNRE
jgi:hypothetical protein